MTWSWLGFDCIQLHCHSLTLSLYLSIPLSPYLSLPPSLSPPLPPSLFLPLPPSLSLLSPLSTSLSPSLSPSSLLTSRSLSSISSAFIYWNSVNIVWHLLVMFAVRSYLRLVFICFTLCSQCLTNI